MLVRAITSFVGSYGGNWYSVSIGEVLEMPAGADWLRAKFVVPVIVEQSAAQTAAIEPGAEAAVMQKGRKRK